MRPGNGAIEFRRVGDQTVAQRASASSPLRFLTPRNHGRAAWVYATNHGGGMVGGDDVTVRIDVDEDAVGVLLSQASLKVYGSAHETRQTLTAQVAPRGTLLIMPDPVACFADSSFVQRQCVELAKDASLLLVDAFTCGRYATGERWRFRRYESRIDVTRAGRRLLHESLRLDSSAGDLAARHGRWNVFALVFLCGPELATQGEALLAEIAQRPVSRRADELVVASPLADGALLRLAATSTEAISAALRSLLSFVPSFIGADPWMHRF